MILAYSFTFSGHIGPREHAGLLARILSIVKEIKMNAKTEGTIAIIAALLVLFSAMWDARISAAISVLMLVALGIYKFIKN